MKIEYFGHSCFRLTGDNGTSVLTDPYTKVGYELPRGLTADIVTVSHGHFDHNYTNGVECTHIVRDIAQRDIDGVEIRGEHSYHDTKQGSLRGENIIFKIKMDGITVCHFGDLGEGYNEALAQKLSGANIWLIPIGGTYTIDSAQAIEYLKKMKPKAVIPMHYLPKDGALDIATPNFFLGNIGEEVKGPFTSLNVIKEDLADGCTKVYYMERQKDER